MKRRVFIRKIAFIFFAAALLLASCQRFLPGPSTQQTTTNQTPGLPVTGGEPLVVVKDQSSDGRTVVVDEVHSKGPGWVAVHIQEGGGVGPAIGHAHVEDGVNKNVVVELEPGKATDVMYAMLHIDVGQVGTYEFPGADVPEVGEIQTVSPEFRVALSQASAVAPVVEVSDQAVTGDLVKINRVVSAGPGWVVVYDDQGGKPGDVIGYSPVQDGENRDVQVTVDTSHMSPRLLVILHVDAGEVGSPEFPSQDLPNGADVPATNNGQQIMSWFQDTNQAQTAGEGTAGTEAAAGTQVAGGAATPTPGAEHQHEQAVGTPGGPETVVNVSDQDALDGTVEIDEVFSKGPGWVAIYSDGVDGQPAEQLGFSPVQDGDNKNVTVQIDASKVTPRLHAILHQDTGQIGTFDFPNADPPAVVGVRIVGSGFQSSLAAVQASQTAQPAQTELMVKAEDQPIRGGTLRIAEVVSDGPGWIGVHISNPDGSLSHSAIGAGHVEKGLNKNVLVRLINPEKATPTMYAMLHVDVGQVGVYEFPKPAVDIPVLVNGAELVSKFTITGGLAGQDVAIKADNTGDTPRLVDSQGYSLYTLSIGECVNECLKDWLPLMVTGKLIAGDGISQQKLGVIALGTGNRQVTYGNLPLYYYAGDNLPGDTNGQGIDGQWFLGRP